MEERDMERLPGFKCQHRRYGGCDGPVVGGVRTGLWDGGMKIEPVCAKHLARLVPVNRCGFVRIEVMPVAEAEEICRSIGAPTHFPSEAPELDGG